MEPAIPGLLGLRASYISAQLGGWRYGTRTAAAPDCMQIVAGLLTEDDVKSRRGLSLVASGANRSVVRAARQSADAAGVRQRTELKGIVHMPRTLKKLLPVLAAWCLLIGAADAIAQQRPPPDAALLARGEYLARAGDCIACHTAREGKTFAGGLAMKTPFGTLYTSNITPDPQTGSGHGRPTSSTR